MNAKFLEIFYCLYYNTNISVEEVYKTARARMIKIYPSAKIPSLEKVNEHVVKTIAKANAIAVEADIAAAYNRNMTGTAAPASESEESK